jgi:uncharacterized protein involved in response to NO
VQAIRNGFTIGAARKFCDYLAQGLRLLFTLGGLFEPGRRGSLLAQSSRRPRTISMNHSLLLHGAAHTTASPDTSPPVLAKGFRPFFLLAALHAMLMVPLWLAIVNGKVAPSPYLQPSVWHAHEMTWGFVSAVVAGFLLTAVGNWTKSETATGLPLAGLALLWVAGRVAMLLSGALPWGVPAAIDLAFLPALALVLARPLVAAKNARNFVVVAIVVALFVANLVVHLEALAVLPWGSGRRATLTSVDLILLLILIIGGRTIPMFTRNATGVATIRNAPWLDRMCIAAMTALLLVQALLPAAGRESAILAGVVGLLAAARAIHWGARYSLRDPLLWILHAGYAWLVVGLLLRAAAGVLGAPPSSAATHALTVGAIGTLTLGMMARVSLGHTGRALVAPSPVTAACVAITLAALARVLVPWLAPEHYAMGLFASGVLWVLAFAAFFAAYAPMLFRPRVDGRPG